MIALGSHHSGTWHLSGICADISGKAVKIYRPAQRMAVFNSGQKGEQQEERNVTDHSYAGNFPNTGNSHGKIHVSHCHRTENFCR